MCLNLVTALIMGFSEISRGDSPTPSSLVSSHASKNTTDHHALAAMRSDHAVSPANVLTGLFLVRALAQGAGGLGLVAHALPLIVALAEEGEIRPRRHSDVHAPVLVQHRDLDGSAGHCPGGGISPLAAKALFFFEEYYTLRWAMGPYCCFRMEPDY